MSLRIRKIWPLFSLFALACSGASEASDHTENVAESHEKLVLATGLLCTVEVTKVDYNSAGSPDAADYIELHISTHGVAGLKLSDCGIGGIALFDDSSVTNAPLHVCTPYSTTIFANLLNLTIPDDGYVEIGQGAGSLVTAVVGTSTPATVNDGWIHNGRGEIAILTTALPAVGMNWLTYGGASKCNSVLLPAPETALQTEADGANFVNVSCDNTFHLVAAANAVQKTTADCPSSGGSGGAGGAGGTSGSGGSGGTLSLGGIGGLLNLGGTAGILNLGGTGGLLNIGGILNLGGTGGSLSVGGAGGTGGTGASAGTAGTVALGGTGGILNLGGDGGLLNLSGNGGTSGETSSTAGSDASAGTAGAGAGTSVGGSDAAGAPSEAEGGRDNEQGGASGAGSSSHAGATSKNMAGTAGISASVAVMVAEGSGCSCSVPSSPRRNTQAFVLALGLLGLAFRRRRARSN